MTKPHKPSRACRQPRLQPQALHRDAASGVVVDAYGNDKGTAERAAHDPDRPTVKTYVGKDQARAVRTPDTIGRLLANGTITLDMARAARRLCADFHTAALEQLHTAPLEVRAKGGSDDTRVMAARERVGRSVGSGALMR